MRASLSLAVATGSFGFSSKALVNCSTAFLKSPAVIAALPAAMALANSASALASRFLRSSYSFNSFAWASRIRVVYSMSHSKLPVALSYFALPKGSSRME